jgi:hypothetical protein
LPAPPLRSNFGEARGDDDDGANAAASAGVGCFRHCLGRDGDDGEVNGLGNVFDRWVGENRLHDPRVPVHGVDRALKAEIEQVVEELTGDGAPLARRADHGHRSRTEDRLERGDGGELLPPLEALDGLRREGRGHRERDLVERGSELEGETGLLEDVEHPVVLRQHHALEGGDAVGRCRLRQVRQEQRAQSSPLEAVRHGEGDLRSVRAGADVRGDAHDLRLRTGGGEQREPIDVIDLAVEFGALLEDALPHGEEPEVPGDRAEGAVEGRHLLGVVRAGGPDVHRRAVT